MSSLSDPDYIGALTDELLSIPIGHRLPLDKVQALLAHPPFISVPGTFNFRDCSLASTDPVFATLTADTDQECPLAPGLFYRCGNLANLRGEGIANLKMMGVRKVFDLRTEAERERLPDPIEELRGQRIEVVWQPDPDEVGAELKSGDVEPGAMKTRAVGLSQDMMRKAEVAERVGLESSVGKAAALELSCLFLLNNVYTQFFRELLEVASLPAESTEPKALLFHCFAGKDRTGILSTLLHLLAGSVTETMVRDFALSRLGTDVVRDMLLAMLQKRHPEFDFNDVESIKTGSPDLYVMLGFSEDVWIATVDSLRATGGTEWYLKECGFSEEDVQKMKDYLTINVSDERA